jgi:hypothetical protein
MKRLPFDFRRSWHPFPHESHRLYLFNYFQPSISEIHLILQSFKSALQITDIIYVGGYFLFKISRRIIVADC